MSETQVNQGYIKGNGKDVVTEASLLSEFSYRAGLEDLIRDVEKIGHGKIEERVAPEKLYQLPAEESLNIPDILKVREVTNALIKHLKEALENVDDEIQRETIMTYFAEDIYKLNKFTKINDNFRDSICLVETAVIAQNSSVYNRKKIQALMNVLDLMRNNIYMREEKLNECFDILEEAEFNINAPIGDIDFGE